MFQIINPFAEEIQDLTNIALSLNGSPQWNQIKINEIKTLINNIIIKLRKYSHPKKNRITQVTN